MLQWKNFLNKKIGDEVVVPDDICLSNCVGAEGVTLVCYANSSFLTPHSSFFSHRIPIPVQQFYDLIIIKSLYSMIVCTLRIGINSHGTSMAYLLKRILHDRYHWHSVKCGYWFMKAIPFTIWQCTIPVFKAYWCCERCRRLDYHEPQQWYGS